MNHIMLLYSISFANVFSVIAIIHHRL